MIPNMYKSTVIRRNIFWSIFFLCTRSLSWESHCHIHTSKVHSSYHNPGRVLRNCLMFLFKETRVRPRIRLYSFAYLVQEATITIHSNQQNQLYKPLVSVLAAHMDILSIPVSLLLWCPTVPLKQKWKITFYQHEIP